MNSKWFNIIPCLRNCFKYIFVTLLLALTVKAHCGSLYYKRITNKDGLSQNWVRCIYQDRVGFMWFGTSGAINRYNGYECKVYPVGNGNVNAISKKDSNELWICTDIGVYTFNLITEKLIHCNFLKTKAILSILCENDSCVWFGSNEGYYKYFTKEHRIQFYVIPSKDQHYNTNYINTLYKDSKRNVWLGTKNGLYVLDYKTKLLSLCQTFVTNENNVNGKVFSIQEDEKHRLWVASLQGGLDVLPDAVNNTANGSFFHVAEGSVITLSIDTKKNLWFATNDGLGMLNLNEYSFEKKPSIRYFRNDIHNPQSLSDNALFTLFVDNMNDVWVGTPENGVTMMSFRGKRFNAV